MRYRYVAVADRELAGHARPRPGSAYFFTPITNRKFNASFPTSPISACRSTFTYRPTRLRSRHIWRRPFARCMATRFSLACLKIAAGTSRRNSSVSGPATRIRSGAAHSRQKIHAYLGTGELAGIHPEMPARLSGNLSQHSRPVCKPSAAWRRCAANPSIERLRRPMGQELLQDGLSGAADGR